MAGVNRYWTSFLLATPALLFAATDTSALLQRAEARINAENFPAAEETLIQAKSADPNNTEVLYRLGYVQFRQRKLEDARKHFTSVVRLAPPAYYSRYFLGRISLLDNKAADAIQWLEPILHDKQNVFDTPAQIASAYAAAGLKAKAVGALQMALASSPWDAALYYRLGRLYTELGRKELAADAFENSRRLRSASREDVETLMKVAQLASDGRSTDAIATGAQIRNRERADPNALVALGVIYGNRDLQSEALAAFETAARLDPRFFQAQYNRGLALLKLNRSAEAIEPLDAALKILPQSMDASRAYGIAAVMNQRYQQAVGPLERVWAGNRADARLGALLATAYLRSGNATKTERLLAGEEFRNPTDPTPLLLRIEALNALENPNGALAVSQEARAKFPTVAQCHLALAQQLARLGRYSEAGPVFAEALRLAPGHPEAELGAADTLARSGEHGAAVVHYRAAATHERTALAARTGLARSLIAMRQFEDARQSLEDSVRIFPSDAGLRVELSRAYARLGKPELAAEQTRIVERLRQPEAR